MAIRPAVPVLLAVAVLAAGCGSSSHKAATADAAFKRGFQQQLVVLHTIGTQVSTAVQSASHQTDAQLKASFKGIAANTRPLIAGLARLSPPAKYRADMDAMRSALSRAYADLRAIAVAAGRHRAKAAKQATNALLSDSVAIKAADTRLSKALGLFGG
jgi:hypothetical protein